MAKGQKRSNREIKKPKKAGAKKGTGPAVSSASSVFAKPSRADAKPKKR
jgi:hypothetical protein